MAGRIAGRDEEVEAMKKIQLPTVAGPARDSVNIIKRGLVPVVMRMQTFHDAWRGADRVYRWYGACVVCGRNCYAFDDGENDCRGALGDNTMSTITAESFEIRACAICANDHESYDKALRMYSDRIKLGHKTDALKPIQWEGKE